MILSGHAMYWAETSPDSPQAYQIRLAIAGMPLDMKNILLFGYLPELRTLIEVSVQ